MALRYIDTELWKTKWFRKLKVSEKAFYYYLISNCDHAGIFEVDLETAEYFIGEKIENPKDFSSDNFSIVEVSDNKWFLIDFLKLQYPKGLNSDKPAIVSVRNRLNEYNLLGMITKRFGNDYLMIKDKDKDKDMFKEKDKDKVELKNRRLKLENELKPFFNEKNQKILNEFLDFWTDIIDFEGNKKMKFELELNWNTEKRLKEWIMNEIPKKEVIEIN